MEIVFCIMLGVPVVSGLVAFFWARKGGPRERAKKAAAAAGIGALGVLGVSLLMLIPVAIVAGFFWLLTQIAHP